MTTKASGISIRFVRNFDVRAIMLLRPVPESGTLPPMAESLAETVARLLTESRAAHDRAKTARHHNQREQAHEELKRACVGRMEAHSADPEHASPAWATENPGHEAMMTFYMRQLGV